MVDDAITAGQKLSQTILQRRLQVLKRRGEILSAQSKKLQFRIEIPMETMETKAITLQTTGFLIAAGDSWFDYPFYDVLKLLEDNHGYIVESAAHRGDKIEQMAYEGGQLEKLARCFEKANAFGAIPKAVLVSGGGNDIAGDEFGMLLNSAGSPISGWNHQILDGLIDQRIFTAYKTMISAINNLSKFYFNKNLPILVHGYDYAIPDGRGFWGGWPFPGPWLEPGFREKLFKTVQENSSLMQILIDRFNDMMQKLLQDPNFSNLHYLDLRGKLSANMMDYGDFWENELHPTERGFAIIAQTYSDKLSGLS